MWERHGFRRSLVAVLPLALSLALPAPALGLDIAVNSTADQPDAAVGNGVCATSGSVCTVRAAFEEANLHNAPGDEDTIALPAGKYVLTEAAGTEDPLLWGGFHPGDELTVSGAGAATTTIEQTSAEDRTLASNAPLVLKGVTISGGDGVGGGGGIYAGAGDLSLEQVSLSGNTADVNGGGGIRFGSVGATLTIVGSTIAGNASDGPGGGIETIGPTTIEGSRIVDNDAANLGGGISFFGTAGDDLRITGSTIAGNEADTGGGIWFKQGELELRDSTLNGNSAAEGGGIQTLEASGVLESSTVSGNAATVRGGGVQRRAEGVANEVVLRHVTVAGNTAPQGPGVESRGPGVVNLQATILSGNGCGAELGGTIDSLGFNLASGNTCSLGEPSDRPNTDAQLGPLRDNGGPTQTHALAATSPALDAAIAAGLVLDQRGLARADLPSVANAPGADGADVGAFELQALPPPAGTVAPAVVVTVNPLRPPRLRLTAKPRQDVTRLRVRVGCDDAPCTVRLGGRASLPRPSSGSGGLARLTGSAGTSILRYRRFALKPKTLQLGAGGSATVPLRFERHRASLRTIQRGLEEMPRVLRRRSRVVVKATTDPAGADVATTLIVLKR